MMPREGAAARWEIASRRVDEVGEVARSVKRDREVVNVADCSCYEGDGARWSERLADDRFPVPRALAGRRDTEAIMKSSLTVRGDQSDCPACGAGVGSKFEACPRCGRELRGRDPLLSELDAMLGSEVSRSRPEPPRCEVRNAEQLKADDTRAEVIRAFGRSGAFSIPVEPQRRAGAGRFAAWEARNAVPALFERFEQRLVERHLRYPVTGF